MRILSLSLSLLLLLPPAAVASLRTTATFYSNYFHGRRMANGQFFSQHSNTIATNSFPLGSKLRVCHKRKCVVGVVRDRCRCSIDLSKGLFKQLAPLKKGRISVTVKKLR